MVSYDYMLGVFACAKNQGRGEFLFHPRMKSVMTWFGQITTPKDPRIANRRHLPPIGNTYALEPSGEFGTIAYLWRDHDPTFSAAMQWLHSQSGDIVAPGVGGAYPALAPYQKLFKQYVLPMEKPNYGSELFPKTGAILRSHFGDDRETQLHIIAGSNHDHYDYDFGSITIWGKGRLISDDFGYYGLAPASDHSMVESKQASGQMQIEAFSTSNEFDYLEGRAGRWTRQIAFLKDPRPSGPNFFVLRDELEAGSGTWRLYLNADRIEIKGDRACVIGKDDVDTDIVFASGAPADLKVETVSRTSNSSAFNRPYATTQLLLQGSLSPSNPTISIVIYPRLKSDPPADIQSKMGGRVIRLDTATSKQVVFLSRESFAYRDETADFEGTVGAAIENARGHALLLGAKGELKAFQKQLPAGEAMRLAW